MWKWSPGILIKWYVAAGKRKHFDGNSTRSVRDGQGCVTLTGNKLKTDGNSCTETRYKSLHSVSSTFHFIFPVCVGMEEGERAQSEGWVSLCCPHFGSGAKGSSCGSPCSHPFLPLNSQRLRDPSRVAPQQALTPPDQLPLCPCGAKWSPKCPQEEILCSQRALPCHLFVPWKIYR